LLTISGTNTYSGGTTINAGELNPTFSSATAQTVGALGTGTITLNAGTLHFKPSANTNTTYTFDNNVVLNGGILYSEDGNLLLGTAAKTINVTGATTLQRQWGQVSVKSLQLNGILSGSAALTLQAIGGAANQGSSIWINNANNTYSGTITVQANTGLGGFAMVAGANNALQHANINLTGVAGGTDTQVNKGGIQFATGVTAPVFGSLAGSGNITLQDLAGTPAAVALKVGSSGSDTTFSGVLSGAGSLNKIGTGTMTLSGANIYTGNTTITAGTLLISSPGSLASGSTVSVNAGVLGGSGTINGPVTVAGGATIQAGMSLGDSATLTLANNLTLSPGSIISLGLGADAFTHDILARTGGTWTFDANQTFSFLDQGAVVGITYTSIITGLAGDPLTTATWQVANGWSGTFAYNAGTNAIDFTLAAIPEPGTWILVGIGLVFMLYRKPRRRTEA
jgi:autotransporter-associated beta strand protein